MCSRVSVSVVRASPAGCCTQSSSSGKGSCFLSLFDSWIPFQDFPLEKQFFLQLIFASLSSFQLLYLGSQCHPSGLCWGQGGLWKGSGGPSTRPGQIQAGTHQGVLQSWCAGYAWGDERGASFCHPGLPSGSHQRLHDEEELPETAGPEVSYFPFSNAGDFGTSNLVSTHFISKENNNWKPCN